MKTLTAILLAALVASGCATTGDSGIQLSKSERLLSKYEPYVGEPVKSFTAFRPDSWQPISRTQLVVWTNMNNAYLLTVAGPCHDLPFARTVGVTSTTSEITTFDSVIVRGNRCPIRQIQPIDVRQMRADRNARKADEKAASGK
jgi:uncharacterized protein DUF6491